jgi:hypothetical protein
VRQVGKRCRAGQRLAILECCGVLGAPAHQGRAQRRRNGCFERLATRLWDKMFTQWYVTQHLGTGSTHWTGRSSTSQRKRPASWAPSPGSAADSTPDTQGHGSRRVVGCEDLNSSHQPVLRDRTDPGNPPKWRKIERVFCLVAPQPIRDSVPNQTASPNPLSAHHRQNTRMGELYGSWRPAESPVRDWAPG